MHMVIALQFLELMKETGIISLFAEGKKVLHRYVAMGEPPVLLQM